MRYRVQAGDTLCLLSQRFGVPLEAILAANSLSDPDMILVGQELIIPPGDFPDPRVVTAKVIKLCDVVIYDDVGLETLGKGAEADLRLTPGDNDNPWIRVFVSSCCRLHYYVSAVDLLIKDNNVVYLPVLPDRYLHELAVT